VAKAVLIAAVPPLLVKTAANPDGLPIEVFDKLRSDLFKNPSQFYKDFAVPFYGANRPVQKSRRECQLKKWSRDKMDALIAGDVAMLKNLSRCTSVPQIRPSQSGKTAM
jgi:hypothetical protein